MLDDTNNATILMKVCSIIYKLFCAQSGKHNVVRMISYFW